MPNNARNIVSVTEIPLSSYLFIFVRWGLYEVFWSFLIAIGGFLLINVYFIVSFNYFSLAARTLSIDLLKEPLIKSGVSRLW